MSIRESPRFEPHRDDLRRLFAMLVVGAVAVAVGACGSRVLDERTPGGIAWAADSAAARRQLNSVPIEPPPEPVPEYAGAASPAPAATELPTETPFAAPAQSSRDKTRRLEPGRCEWQANLARAAAGRTADWIVLDTGAWGRAEVPGTRIWIAPRTPCDKVYSVAVHEWTHHMQGVVYGDWGGVVRELAPYGGPEIVADCGALILGATWIRYGCPGGSSHSAAAAILLGERAGQ